MAIPPDWRWKISYSTTRDQDRGRSKSYDGSLRYWKAKDWLLLMNAKAAPLVGRALKEGEKISIGSEVKMPNHYVSVTSCISSPSGDLLEMDRGLGFQPPDQRKDASDRVTSKGIPCPGTVGSTSVAVHDALALGLDFSPGLSFAKRVRREFFSTVHPSKDSYHFTMVVSFGRSSFKLTEDTVSLALESAIGGLCDELKVSLLRDRVFSFTVSSKQIGFLIYQTRSFSVSRNGP
jgi:hypothetical protein